MMSDSKIVYWYRRNGSMVRERYRMLVSVVVISTYL